MLRVTAHSACAVLLLVGSPVFSAKPSQSDSYDYGQLPLPHAPAFQRGNKLSQPLSEFDPAVKQFLTKKLNKSDVVSFPSTRDSDI